MHGVRLLLAKMRLYISTYRQTLPECHCDTMWSCPNAHAANVLRDFAVLLEDTSRLIDFCTTNPNSHQFEHGSASFFRESRIYLEQLGFMLTTISRTCVVSACIIHNACSASSLAFLQGRHSASLGTRSRIDPGGV